MSYRISPLAPKCSRTSIASAFRRRSTSLPQCACICPCLCAVTIANHLRKENMTPRKLFLAILVWKTVSLCAVNGQAFS